MIAFGPFELLVGGVLGIYLLRRVGSYMHRRRWIGWNPRGASSALGNAVMAVQSFYEPPVREVLEERLRNPEDERESGAPPEPGESDGT